MARALARELAREPASDHLFTLSRPLAFLDYLRVPHAVDGDREPSDVPPPAWHGAAWGVAEVTAGSRRLLWPYHADAAVAPPSGRVLRWGDARIHGPVVTDAALRSRLEASGDGWEPVETLTDLDGRPVASVWRDGDGSVLLPFDPDAAMRAYWTESYLALERRGAGGPARALATRAYYHLRFLIPRPLQVRMRRAYARVQARREFPAWPVEDALHRFYVRLFALVEGVAGEPVPWIGWWPEPYTWALVLSHDVETSRGYRRLARLRAADEAHGYRASWNFVPQRYAVDDALLREMVDAGLEVGLHGLKHDGRDLVPGVLEKRLPEMHAWAARWGARGFRSPSTHRDADLMAKLGFAYDSSYPDTDPYEPQPGGCCSWLPYPLGATLELPITMPQDHTLFAILRETGERRWVEKADALRERGGMALLLTHPDYFGASTPADAYDRFLARYADDPTAWRPLPGEVADWWRRRDASRLVRDPRGWTISGDAAGEGRVRFDPPGPAGD